MSRVTAKASAGRSWREVLEVARMSRASLPSLCEMTRIRQSLSIRGRREPEETFHPAAICPLLLLSLSRSG